MAKKKALKKKVSGARKKTGGTREGVGAETGGRGAGSAEVDARIGALGDWRGEVLARVREIVLGAAEGIVEEVKWRKPSNGMLGVPVWSCVRGAKRVMICTGETYKEYVKLTFANGAALEDPSGLFNAGLGGGVRRAIDIREGERIDGRALGALVREAAGL